MRVTFVRRKLLTPHVWTFTFEPEKPLDYIAGQYAELHLPHQNADSRGDWRWFTIASAPNDPEIRITTKIEPNNGSSFKRALMKLSPGAELTLSEPIGDFVLPKDPHIPLVFVAGGVGITPVYSMVKWLHQNGEQRRIQIIYVARHAEDLAYPKLFQTYDLDFIPVLTEPAAGWHGESGIMTGERVLQLINGDDGEKLFYFSGPQAMVETTIADLRRHGLESSRVVMDYFPGYVTL